VIRFHNDSFFNQKIRSITQAALRRMFDPLVDKMAGKFPAQNLARLL